MAFQPRKNLPKGVMFTKHEVGYKANKSEMIDEIMHNKSMAGVLNQKRERMEFFDRLREKTGGHRSVRKNDVKEVLGDLRLGRGRTIDRLEAQKLAGQFFGGSMQKKYIFGPAEKNGSAQKEKYPLTPAEKKKSAQNDKYFFIPGKGIVSSGNNAKAQFPSKNSPVVDPLHGNPAVIKGNRLSIGKTYSSRNFS